MDLSIICDTAEVVDLNKVYKKYAFNDLEIIVEIEKELRRIGFNPINAFDIAIPFRP